MAKTLFDKIWERHEVVQLEDGTSILYIDLQLVHEVTSPQAFEGLRLTGRTVRHPELTHATMDHPILKIDAHNKEVRSIAYTPSGKHLVTGSDDGSIRTWQADPSDTVEMQPVPVSDDFFTISDRFRILDAYSVPNRKLRVDGIDTMNDALTMASANVLAIGRNQFVGVGRGSDSAFRDIGAVVVLYDFDGAPHIVAQTNRKESKIELLGFADGVLFVHLPKAKQIVRVTGD